MDISIVTTMYYSAPYLQEFYERTVAETRKITEDFEIVLVNDGSPDNSLELAVSLYEKDPRVKVVDLSRNFGHHKAMMTGLAHADGDLVFLIDCDLEEEPENLVQFHEKLKSSGADVVYGVQKTRKGDFFEKITGNVFYWMFNLLSSQPIPPNVVTSRLMTRRYVASLLEHRDREVFIEGLWAITGYAQVPLMLTKLHKGSSTYSLGRKLALVVNSITSFSNRPLIVIFVMGIIITAASCVAALFTIIRTLLFMDSLTGWPSLIISVWLMGGLTIFCLGIIGIYLSKIFMETKPRPYTIVRDLYKHETEPGDGIQRDNQNR